MQVDVLFESAELLLILFCYLCFLSAELSRILREVICHRLKRICVITSVETLRVGRIVEGLVLRLGRHLVGRNSPETSIVKLE